MQLVQWLTLLVVVMLPLPSGALLIDTFESPTLQIANRNGPTTSTVAAPGVLGGFRTLEVRAFLGTGPLQIIAGSDNAGVLTHDSGAVNSKTAAVWDGGGTGLGGIDITEGGLADAFVFDLVSLQNSGNFIRILVRDVVGRVSIGGRRFDSFQAGTAVELGFPTLGGIDLTAVDAIELEIDDESFPQRIEIDNFRTNAIPEPSTLALVLMGTALFPSLIRKRSNC